MNVYIFYNGGDFHAPLPQDDKWSNYFNENTPRLFLACAASWQMQGFTVKRLTTRGLKNGFDFKGVLRRDLDRYPVEYWNTWHVWRRLAPCLVCNIDVFNFGLVPAQLIRFMSLRGNEPFAMHVNGWTASIGYVTRYFCDSVIDLINDVDAGKQEPPICDLLIDDKIVNKYFAPERYKLCGFAHIDACWHTYPLAQFPRSTITRSLEHIDTV